MQCSLELQGVLFRQTAGSGTTLAGGRRSRTAGISVIMCLSSRGVKKLVVEWGAKLELGPPRAWGMVVHV